MATGTDAVERESEDGDIDESACNAIRAIEQMGSQWRLVVLYDLAEGERRFNELKRSTGASSRTLSRVLDDLGEMDFVDRRMEEDAPVATYYSLTEKGASLCPVFEAVENWADEWLADPGALSDGAESGIEEDAEDGVEPLETIGDD